MRLEETGPDFIDLGYEIPQPGVSLVQFEEGVTKQTNEKSGKTTLRLPMQITGVIEGPEENEGRKMSHFVPIETDYGAKQLSAILRITGLLPGFLKAFGKDADPLEEKFLNMLKLKLPGKLIKVHHNLRVDPKGKEQVNITRLEKPGNGNGEEMEKDSPAPSARKKEAASLSVASEDWD